MKKKHMERGRTSFTGFFAGELRPILREMEKIRRKRILLYGMAALLLLFLSLFLFRPYFDGFLAVLFFLVAANVAWLLRGLDQGLFLPHRMRSRLCREVVPKCIDYALPGLECRPVQHIRPSLFIESGLFTADSKSKANAARAACESSHFFGRRPISQSFPWSIIEEILHLGNFFLADFAQIHPLWEILT